MLTVMEIELFAIYVTQMRCILQKQRSDQKRLKKFIANIAKSQFGPSWHLDRMLVDKLESKQILSRFHHSKHEKLESNQIPSSQTREA